MLAKTLISVVGPTAIGKTRLAILLAQYFDTEIISADSRQFYKEMKIGTAVPNDGELAAAKHHFIQHKSIFTAYSVGDFERDAIQLLTTLFQTHNIVVQVGGSGLYVDAVAYGLDTFPEVDPKIRESLVKKHQSEGIASLQAKLKQLDPYHYAIVDLENPHRLIRALEVSIGSGKPYSTFLNKKKGKRPFNNIFVGLYADREVIYNRINTRVDHMMENGLLEEAMVLFENRNLNALQTVGYKELFEYLDGQCTIDVAISEIKKNTRRFAKRQVTWYRKNKQVIWIGFDDVFEHSIAKITHQIKTL
ncbi:MAG: tRNA (adenosine(37)-N6)-dimethylallyltransferase MiaA [Bacteroidota bacterium]